MAKSQTTAHRCAAAQSAPVDSDTIRGAYTAVLSGSGPGTLPAAPDLFAAQLAGHIGLLMEEIRVDRMRGEWRRTAEHVLGRARQLVDDAGPPLPSDARLWALATYCRALHSLHQRAPLDGPPAAGSRP